MHVNKSITDLKFNVAQLLREEVGSRRDYDFAEDRLPLDDDEMELRGLTGRVRFIRTVSGVLGDVSGGGTVEMECIRCLTRAAQPVEFHFQDEFHSRIEVNTGVALPKPDEEDPFYIDESHMVDLGEAIREYTLLELPMQPLCRPDCRGLCPICGKDRNVDPCTCADTGGDDRFGILRSLLTEE
ncbi:MAG TPA: DUF177 domain-containing protein [Roseiflexaceae bacterium]|nr:DUF177 domain-containing protein [Roseiflexaceae bacterium]